MNAEEIRSVRRIAKRCGIGEDEVLRALKALSRGDRALYRQIIGTRLHPETAARK